MLNKTIDHFRLKLETGNVFGIFSKTSDSSIVEAAGLAGLDFIILDMEHGLSTTETITHHVRAALLTGMAPIVRVNGVNPHAISSALDMGAVGVQVPNISTAEEARQAVKAARFYPEGMRGVCRFVRSANYGGIAKEDYFQYANKTIVILQVEGMDGIKNLDEILEVEGYDILFIGPYDLSQSLGIPGQIDAPEILLLMQEVSSKARSYGRHLGTFCDSLTNSHRFVNTGFNYMSYSVDVSIFRETICNLIGSFRGEN
jgi:4-hydroxy-2-oxoheptanedioate aldolase